MRRKASPKKVSFRNTRGNDNKVPKPILKPTKTPTGKGLGKAGAKRLGRLLKRAIQFLEEEPAVKRKLTLPKTPIRLFKHQVQKEVENEKASKPASAHVSRLIVSLVSQCKHRGGISMADLKNTLATEGYNVTRKQVNVVTKRLINNETLVRTTRNSSFRLHNKNPKQNDTSQSWKSNVTHKKPKEGLTQNRRASKSSKGVEKLQRPTRKTPKDTGKSYKPKGKTKKKTVKSHKPKGKTRKSTAKSHTRRRRTTRARRKMPHQAGRGNRTKPKLVAQVQKAPKKIKRAQSREPRQNRHPSKSSGRSRKPQKKSVRKTVTRKARDVRRRGYYYEE